MGYVRSEARMLGARKRDILVALSFLLFSVWFVGKSFGFDGATNTFWVARHQVGDFGLHLSIARSISYGANWPVELPFYPGKPLAYHYGFDLIAGLLERVGVRLDIGILAASAVALTALLFGIYLLGRSVFCLGRLASWVAAVLSIVGGGLAPLVTFLQSTSLPTILGDLWKVPDYIYKGPFDGSAVLIFFTPNVLLNQRHLIVALAVFLWTVYFLMKHQQNRELPALHAVLIGVLVGLSLYFHSLLFLAECFVVFFLCVDRKHWKTLVYLLIPIALITAPHILVIGKSVSGAVGHPWVRLGFLTPSPVTIGSLILFWFTNLGLTMVTVPAGLLLANKSQRILFVPFAVLFVAANIIQFSFRIDHNHTLFNLIFVIGNLYTMLAVSTMWKRGPGGKIVALVVLVLLSGSGVLNLMAVKNDFRYPLPELNSPFARWVRSDTSPQSIFLSYPDTIDPVTLAGRKTFVGASYYLDVLGYSYTDRQQLAAELHAARNEDDIVKMRSLGIDYILIPKVPKADYPYFVNERLFRIALTRAYEDESVTVYSL